MQDVHHYLALHPSVQLSSLSQSFPGALLSARASGRAEPEGGFGSAEGGVDVSWSGGRAGLDVQGTVKVELTTPALVSTLE